MSYERQGTGYDSGASGHERQGRASGPSKTTERGNETKLADVLTRAYNAVQLLNDDALGFGDDGYGHRWPIRDELMGAIDHQISLVRAQPPQPTGVTPKVDSEWFNPLDFPRNEGEAAQPTDSAAPSRRNGSHQGEALPNGDTARSGGATQSVAQPTSDVEGLVKTLRYPMPECTLGGFVEVADVRALMKRMREAADMIESLNSRTARIIELLKEADSAWAQFAFSGGDTDKRMIFAGKFAELRRAALSTGAGEEKR